MKKPIIDRFVNTRKHLCYYHSAPRYWVRATDFTPYFRNKRTGQKLSPSVKILKLQSEEDVTITIAILNNSLFYWWFILVSSCRSLMLDDIKLFPAGIAEMSNTMKSKLAGLVDKLMDDFQRHSERTETRWSNGIIVQDLFQQKPSKPIVDEIDRVLAEHYGFTDEELDFIINYDIKFRMGLGS